MKFLQGSIALLLGFTLWLQAAGEGNQGGPSQPDEKLASDLWEQAIAAKGGRQKLQAITSLRISYQETSRNVFGLIIHRGLVERIYAFPDRAWSWEDGLPPPFHLSVGWINLKENTRCTDYAVGSAPACGPAKHVGSDSNEGIDEAQYIYLMESNWVKPRPLSVWTSQMHSIKADVLTTQFQNKRIDYFLDPKSHLPLRVSVFYNNSERPTRTVDLSEYHLVNGIQMPGKQKAAKISIEINPPYDPELFTRRPSIQAGPDVWRLR